MKYILILLVVFISGCEGKSQIFFGNTPVNDSNDIRVTRYLCVNNDSFCVEYKYNSNHYFEPSVGRYICDSNGSNCVQDTAAYRLSRHYFAKISVFLVTGKGEKIIGNPFFGYYSPIMCYEDSPQGFVQKAKELQVIIDSNIVLQKKNGINAIYKYIVTWTYYETGLDSGGLTIKELHQKKIFSKNINAHKFIDEQLSMINSGVDYRIDSILINKNLK